MKITVDRQAVKRLGQSAEMRRHLEHVADTAADEVERRFPHPDILGGVEARSGSDMGSDGWEGYVAIHGPGWHLWEYGTVNHGPRPAVRPGVQSALSRFGGQFKSTR